VPEPYRSPDWALVPGKTGPRLNTNDDDDDSSCALKEFGDLFVGRHLFISYVNNLSQMQLYFTPQNNKF
jgi:hypothetical protein